MTLEEKQKILLENLQEFSAREDLLKRQKNLTAIEIAKLRCEASPDIDTLRELLYDFRDFLSATEEISLLSDLLSTELGGELKRAIIIGSSEPTPAGAHAKISYVKNKYNDEAFECFSRSVTNAKAIYAASFKEAAESVYDGRCEFCILPITNSSEGRLMSFYSLLDRYELKICETVDLDVEGSSEAIRCARAGKACKEPRLRSSQQQNYIFEFSVASASTDFLVPIFEGARQIDAKLISIDSLPLEYSSNSQRFFFSFSIPQKKAIAFRLFIALKNQSYTPIGLYAENE